MQTPLDLDNSVAIAGGGPAATALANALAGRGLQVTVVAPGGLQAPTHTLCAFADQVPAALVTTLYPRTLVVGDAGDIDLERPYARLDPADLVRVTGDVQVEDGRVLGRTASGVATETGVVSAAVVVDATGHRPVLVEQGPGKPAWQSAYGIVVAGRDADLPDGTALFMDWRDAGVDDGGPPSFLYALSRGGRLLLEETTLASWMPVEPALLKARLTSRLRRRGTIVDAVVDEERVCFPMGGGLPRRGQHTVAFGAALGAVSPISGYSVATTLAHVDLVADAIVAAGRAGAPAADAVLDAVWTRAALQRRRLQRFALRAACAFDQRAADAFFATFFALPAARWRGFLDGSDDVVEVRRTMLALFGAVPQGLRFRLVAGAASADGLAVARDLFAGARRPTTTVRSA